MQAASNTCPTRDGVARGTAFALQPAHRIGTLPLFRILNSDRMAGGDNVANKRFHAEQHRRALQFAAPRRRASSHHLAQAAHYVLLRVIHAAYYGDLHTNTSRIKLTQSLQQDQVAY